jgi:hypothetical protein
VNILRLARRALLRLAPRRRVREAFTEHYERGDWGEPETPSGKGSSMRSTASVREALPALLAELGVRTMVDAGCGDFHWLRTLDLDLDDYLGLEVVPALAQANQARHGRPAPHARRFAAADIVRDRLPRADLILSRDCLVHLETGQVRAAIANFRRSGSRWLLATTFVGEHPDGNSSIPLGGWRPLQLDRPPFDLGPPTRLLSEAASVEDPRYADKCLGLWEIGSRERRSAP